MLIRWHNKLGIRSEEASELRLTKELLSSKQKGRAGMHT